MKRPRDTSPGPGTSANYGHTARSQRPVDQGRHRKFVNPKVCNPPKCACHDPNPEATAQMRYNQQQQQQQQPFVLWQPGCEQMVAPWPWQPSAWHYASPPPSLIAPPSTPTFWQYPTYSWSPNCNCYIGHHPVMSRFCDPPTWSTEAVPHMDDAPPRQQELPVTTHCVNQPFKTEGEGDVVKQEAAEDSFFTMLPSRSG